MKRLVLNSVLSLALLSFLSAPAWAAPRTVVLSVPGMTCPVCPITVKTALQRAPGVEQVTVNFSRKEIRVRYNDAKTNVAALEKVTARAGYPSHIEKATQK